MSGKVRDEMVDALLIGITILGLCLTAAICLSGCAWLNRPPTPAEQAAQTFARMTMCDPAQTFCAPEGPAVFRCRTWGQRGIDPDWCLDGSGTVDAEGAK